MSQRSIFNLRTIALLLSATLALGSFAHAATFSVDPILVTLEKSNSSASIAVTNQTPQQLRLQITGFAWSQTASGQIKLSKTDQLVFFPQLITLGAGETKRVRVGVTAPQGATEKTYRVFMEQLPSLQSVLAPRGRAQVTLLLKVGIPVFLKPAGSTVVAGAVRNASIRGKMLAFDVANTGNSHFSIQSVSITGKNRSGGDAFSQNLTGWYVLAGTTRRFEVPITSLTSARCATVSSLSVQVRTDAGRFGQMFPGVRKECGSISAR